MEKDENQSDCKNKTEMDGERDPAELTTEEDTDSVADTSEASETDVSESRPSCPICLRSFSCQQIGFPADCSSIQHIFCALCIEEWAKNVTTCPIDRKEFTKICILDNWLNREQIRTVEVTRKEYNEQDMETVDDLTYCEICHLANNEHLMLLCDGCDRGYHMDCLSPRLSEIPAGSWYCRLCVTNQEVGAQIVQNHEAMEALSDSESESTPRIIRTRATERIRAAIMTRGDLFSESEAEQPATVSQPQPGPSRIRSTLERVRRALKRGTRKRRKRRTRRTARSSVVEEYDINSGDEKFPIKRTTTRGRVVRRKRKTKKRRTKKKTASCAFTIPSNSNNTGINAMRYNAGVPTVRLFEPSNNLEYFSDDEDDMPIMQAVPVTRQNASVNLLTAMQGRIGANRNLLKRKIIATPIASSSVNLLDSIMESQEKWHSKKGLSDNCVLKGGRPVFNGNRPEVTQAPLNGIGNNGATTVAANSQPETENRSSEQQTEAAETPCSETNSTETGGGANDGNSEGQTNTGRSVVNTFSPLPQRPQKTAASRKSFDIFGEDENKSCPNFSVYSTESMDLAKNKKADESEGSENNGETDERVDLVQLSGDEEEPEEEKQPEEAPTTVSEEKPNDTQGKSQVLHLYDSDNGLDEELNKHFENQEGSENVLQQPDRSYTPCLDEKYPNKDCEEGELDKSAATSATGIDGMETELISEEEDSNMSADKNGEKSDKAQEKQPITPFKKVQNRDRNYREKDRGKRRHSRDRSEDKENKSKKTPNKKREMPRYNVREVITKASQRDPFGRTKPRDRSRSRSKSLTRRRSRSRSRSKSRSSWSRKSFTISRSPSYSPRPNKRTRSPSLTRRRIARSKSPVRRISRPMPGRRSFSKSPSRPPARSKSPFRRKEVAGGKRKDKERKKKKNRSKERKKRSQDARSSEVEPMPWNAAQVRRTSITRHPSPSWTPPLGTLKGSQENLRVVLQNREAATTNRTKKKDKKKKSDKKKNRQDRRERHRHEKTSESGKNRAPPTSKEVFASGDNILVSVSFNNTSANDKQPASGDAGDREIRRVERDPTKTLQLKDPLPPRPVRKHRKIDTKPVAYIDLDGSPFNEAPASPVIVLSDSDHERDNNEKTADAQESEQADECVRPASPPESPNAEDQFRLQAPSGPKTPPEPTTTSIKFSMPSKTRLRVMNNLFEDEDDEEPAPTNNRTDKDGQTAAQKIGPNTPPDPTPKSPDVYDPFEPTKSPSESPAQDTANDDGPLSRSSTPPLEDTQKTDSDKMTQEKLNQLKPVELVMSLVNKSMTGSSQEKGEKGLQIESIDEMTETHNENDKPMEKQITILSNVVVQTPCKYNIKTRTQTNSTPLKSGTQKLSIKSLNSLQGNTSGSIISKLPLPRTTSSKSHASGSGANAAVGANSSMDMEIDSPYSPGSNDFDDLFEPPSSTTDNYKPSHSKNVSSTTRGNIPVNKADLFDNLFGSSSPTHKFSTVTTTYKINTKTTRGKPRKANKRNKFDDDEVPNSAVDLQVKDKLLRKLNRQERVIEEVKLVIKPHYNKKRITKEEYKEIMRKAVPKICHSRTGEINPVKIQTLVEAYVKKVRQRRKMANKMQSA